ncbi:MAG: choice-of-anchor D domain-containing protein [Fidelibacterota bacterium]|nr:MAG: choice-of-anchor D domain-containing protein [Candidatus Neomarinimicrobiota bacterium]
MNGLVRRAIVLSVIILGSSLLKASIPPHSRVQRMIDRGEIPTPYYLENRSELLARGLNAAWTAPLLRDRRTLTTADEAAMSRSLGPATVPSGSYNALVLLVDFSDQVSQVPDTSFDDLIFADVPGSMRDYFQVISYGTLDIVTVDYPGAIGWSRAPQTYAYYVDGQHGFGDYPQNAQKLVEDVVAIVDPVVDFSQYDNDGDGYVDALFVVHSGPGAEFTGSNYDIWSHAWQTVNTPYVDGVYVDRYSMEPEYWDSPGDMTIGVFAHELGHSGFGLPDLYDRDYSSAGLGVWSLMAGGSWNGFSWAGGDSPAFPDAWSHYQMGYVTPTNVTVDATGQTIANVETTPAAYRLWTNGQPGQEYFLVENRQQIGYDSALPGSGLLIYHVDEAVASQNDDEWYPGHTASGHYLVALEQADGLWNLEQWGNQGDSGDPFPGVTGNTAFHALSTPNSKDYNDDQTCVVVNNISNSASTMTADLGVTPPIIGVAPDALGAELLTGATDTQTLTISNTGSGILFYTLASEESTPPAVADRTLPSTLDPPPRVSGEHHSPPSGRGESFPILERVLDRVMSGYNVFYDDMENGLNGWTVEVYTIDNLWHQTNTSYNSPVTSWWCAIEDSGHYATGNAISTAAISPTIDLTTESAPITLQFFECYDTEPGWDFCMVDVSIDGGSSWIPLRGSRGSAPAGSSGGWITSVLDLSAYAGEMIQLRFFFDTDDAAYNDYPGWFFDDVLVSAAIPWLGFNPNSGNVLPGTSADINVTFDAAGLASGEYAANIVILNGDTLNPEVRVPAYLYVTGAPDIAVSSDTLDFGSAYVGHVDSLTLVVYNGGVDPLTVTNIASSHGAYTTSQSNFVLQPNENQEVLVTFAPATAGDFPATLTISSDDPDEPTITIGLLGKGINPPVIAVAPDSLHATLLVGQSTVQYLTIDNSAGSGELNFEITIQGAAAASIEKTIASIIQRSGILNHNIRVDVIEPESGDMTERIYTSTEEIANVKYHSGTSGGLAVAIVAADYDSYITDVQNKLLATGKFASVATINTNVVTPTLAELQAFDAVIVWKNYTYLDQIALGDNLASYVDGGGGVVLAVFESGGMLDRMLGGRWASEEYYVISRSPSQTGQVTLGTIAVPDHPIMSGVYSLDGGTYSYRPSTTSLTEGSTLIASWSDGIPLAAVKDLSGVNRADLGLFPPSSDIITSWLVGTDGDLLMANALVWVAGGGVKWLTANPTSGTIPAGSFTNITVTFDATGLLGGEYYADLIVTSNDPVNPEVIVTANLTAIGAPDITVNPDTLHYGPVYLGLSSEDTVVVANQGSDVLTVSSISADNDAFSPSISAFSLDPGESQEVAVTFTPANATSYLNHLTIISNDPDESVMMVVLEGEGVAPPVIAVTPDSLHATLLVGQSTVQYLTIDNAAGSGELNFDITIQAAQAGPVLAETGWDSERAYHEDYNVSTYAVVRGDPTDSFEDIPARGSDLPNPMIPQLTTGEIVDSIPLPVGTLENGMAWSGSSIWVTDFNSNQIIELNPDDGTIISSIPAPGATNPSELAWDGAHLWHVDFGVDVIYELDPNNGTVLSQFPPPSLGEGLTWDGDDLWYATSQMLYRMNTSGTVLEQVANGSGYEDGLVWIQDYLWIATNGAIAKVDPATGTVLENVGFPFNHTNGLAFDGQHLLVADNDAGVIYKVDVEAMLTSWLAANPTSGTIPAGSFMNIEVTFDATGLLGGEYYADLAVTSNDPVNPEVIVTANLTAIGAPDITVNPDSLHYGPVYLGLSRDDTLAVSNQGSDVLTVSSISADNDAFSPSISAFSLNPGESQEVAVAFTPANATSYLSHLTIISNDPDESVKVVVLEGEGVAPPVIAVDPDSLSEVLAPGDSSVQYLTIDNSAGAGNLNVSLTVAGTGAQLIPIEVRHLREQPTTMNISRSENSLDAPEESANLTTPPGRLIPDATVSLPFHDGFEDGDYDGWTDGGGSGVREVTSSTAAVGNYSFHFYYADSIANHFHGIHQVFNAGAQPEYVSFYIRSGSTSQSDAYFVLTSNGGMTEVIWFFARSTGYLYINANVGGDESYAYNAHQWYHIELRDIDWSSKNFDYYVDGSLIMADIPFRNAASVNDVDVLYIYNYSPGSDGWWDEIDVGGVPSNWLKVSPVSATIPAGTAQDFAVTFNATGLSLGDYTAGIQVSSNDPFNPEIWVPATLHVRQAELVLSSDSLDFGIATARWPVTQTLLVSNAGAAVLTVTSISSDQEYFTTDASAFNLDPGASLPVQVTFSPLAPGTYSGLLTISSNDPEEPVSTVILHGEAILGNEPPGAFSLTSPEDSADVTSLTPLLSWAASIDPAPLDTVRYALYLDSPGPGVEILDAGTDTSYQIPAALIDNTIYHWKVVARDQVGATRENSGGFRSFVTNTANDPPEPIFLVTPTDSSIEADLTPLFYWTEGKDPDPNDDLTYNLTFWRSGSTPTGSRTTDTNAVVLAEPLSDNSQYLWSVVCTDPHGAASESETMLFWTDAFPEAPQPFTTIFPAPDSIGLPLDVRFVWHQAVDPDPVDQVVYTLVLATNWDDSSTYEWLDGILDTSITIPFEYEGTYYWLVEATDDDEFVTASNDGNPLRFAIGTPMSLVGWDAIPAEFALHQNYPNPFNPASTIRFDLPEAADVTIIVYDLLGREIVRLAESRIEPGYHQVIWEGRDNTGRDVPTGIYIARLLCRYAGQARLTTPAYTRSIKMLLMK